MQEAEVVQQVLPFIEQASTPPQALTMPPMNIHLCLVSGDAAPNLTPLLDIQTRPEQVILLHAQEMAQQADWLEQVMRQLGAVKVRRCLLQSQWHIESIQEHVSTLLAKYDDQAIALNATGGTRPMSLAAYEAFRAGDKPIFYVDTRQDRLCWMYPRNVRAYQLVKRIQLPDFIRACGSKVLVNGGMSVSPARQAFAQELIANIRHYSQALAALNWLANTAQKDLCSKPLENWHLAARPFRELLDRLRELGVAYVRNQRMIFPDEAARFFVNGGWLEHYVHATVNSLKPAIPAIQDSAQTLLIERAEGVRDEIDVALLADNKLHLIECKAKKLKKGTARTGAEAIYKLDTLTALSGDLHARTMLVSYQPMRDVDLHRAQAADITVLQEKQLQNLRSYLEDWLLDYLK